MQELENLLKISERDKQKEAITELKKSIEKDKAFMQTIDPSLILKQDISDYICTICGLLKIKIPEENFSKFWACFIQESIRPKNYLDGLETIAYYFENYSSVNIEGSESIYSIIFYRIEKVIVEYDFEEINEVIINTLAAIAPYAPLRHFLSPSLFDSITCLFMNHEATHEASVLFLWRFFHRSDASEALDQLVMNFIVSLPNYAPPKHSLWRFLCFFFANFSEQIEDMCDFDAMEKGGCLPIFTRSLIWSIRLVIQHPIENEDEPLYWDMCFDVLSRYEKSEPKSQVRRLYDYIFNELRISICYSLKAVVCESKILNKKALDVWRLLVKVDSEGIMEGLNLLWGDLLDVNLSFCLISENQNMIEYVKKFAEDNQICIKEIMLSE